MGEMNGDIDVVFPWDETVIVGGFGVEDDAEPTAIGANQRAPSEVMIDAFAPEKRLQGGKGAAKRLSIPRPQAAPG